MFREKIDDVNCVLRIFIGGLHWVQYLQSLYRSRNQNVIKGCY